MKKINKYLWIFWALVILAGIGFTVLQIYSCTILLIFGIVMLIRWWNEYKKIKEA